LTFISDREVTESLNDILINHITYLLNNLLIVCSIKSYRDAGVIRLQRDETSSLFDWLASTTWRWWLRLPRRTLWSLARTALWYTIKKLVLIWTFNHGIAL